MTPKELQTHFYKVMPWLTTKFSQTVNVVSAKTVVSGDWDYFNIEVELTEIIPEDIYVGGFIHLSHGKLKNNILSAVNPSPQVWVVKTKNPHFQITPTNNADNKEILLNGVPIPLVAADKRDSVTVTNETEPIGSFFEPVKAEFGYCEVLAIDGMKVTLKPNTGYLYEAEIADLIVTTRLNVAIVKDVRIAPKLVGDLDQNQCYAMIVMGDEETIKKGQYALVVDSINQNAYHHLDIVAQFVIVVVWSSADIEAQAIHMSEGFDAMKKAMNRLFYGASLANLSNTKSIVPVGNGVADVGDNANYAHRYEFQAIYQIDMPKDGFKEEYTKFEVPIRDFVFGGGVDGSGNPLPSSSGEYFEIQTGGNSAPMPLTLNLDGP